MGIFEKYFSRLLNPKCEEFILGEKFPWEGYNSLGDHISVALFETSFDIVISLSNLSDQEEKAIGDEEFEVFITPTPKVPFIIMKFGEVFKADATVNLKKLDADFHEMWLKSSLEDVRIFLLEGNDATLKCIRTFKFLHADYIRETCRQQLKYEKEDIDAYINAVYQQIPVDSLMHLAQAHFVVPAAISL